MKTLSFACALFLILLSFIQANAFAKLEKIPKNRAYKKVVKTAKTIIEREFIEFGDGTIQAKDMNYFCPRYHLFTKDKHRIKFWSNFLAILAWYESKHNTYLSSKENNGNISRGLLQISYKSLNNAYRRNGCNLIQYSEDLHHPEKNIRCALGIFQTWLQKEGYISGPNRQGVARYWSPVRSPYRAYIKKKKEYVDLGFKHKIRYNMSKKYKSCFKKFSLL